MDANGQLCTNTRDDKADVERDPRESVQLASIDDDNDDDICTNK